MRCHDACTFTKHKASGTLVQLALHLLALLFLQNYLVSAGSFSGPIR